MHGQTLAVISITLAWLLSAGLGIAWSQEIPAAEEVVPNESVDAGDEEEESSFLAKLAIHGYLTQAYAATNGNTIAGIPRDGTADYRTAALQIRATVTDQDSFAIQLSHERLGVSGLDAFQDDVALDWLFYERKLGGSSIKVGRVLIPFGIYNQVRDVGTLLPFYRPSVDFYGEGSYTSETVDGILLSHLLPLGEDWRLEGSVYYGSWDYIARDPDFRRDSVDDALGFEVWLDTPLPGLRFGAGEVRWDIVPLGEKESQRWRTYHLSLAGRFGRVTTNLEYKYNNFVAGNYRGGYAHVGVALTDRITVNAQLDHFDLVVRPYALDQLYDKDKALGVTHAFRPDLVLKLEHHWNEGYSPELPAQNYFAPAPKTRSWITSLSASF